MERKLFYRRGIKQKILWEARITADAIVYAPAEAVRGVLLTLLVTVLFAQSALLCFRDVFEKVKLDTWSGFYPIISVIPMILFFELFLRIKPEYMVKIRFLVPLIYVFAYGIFFYRHQSVIVSGTKSIGAYLIKAINYYYKLNLKTGTSDFVKAGEAFRFWLACLLAFLLLQALWTKKRIVIGLLPLLVIALELMVGYAPGKIGLILGFVGVLCANTGEWREEGAAWAKAKGWEWEYKERMIPILAGITAAVILSAASCLIFQKTAEKMVSSGLDLHTFQSNLESRIENLSLFFSFSFETSGSINNRTPKYRDEEVLRLELSRFPKSSIYLRGFYGSRYENGSWETGGTDFAEACTQAGFDPEELIVTVSEQLASGSSTLDPADLYDCTYVLEYTNLSTKELYLPYFIQLSSLTKKYPLSGDYTLSKKKGDTSVTVQGWMLGSSDQAEWEGFDYYLDSTDQTDWYNQFVQHYYLTTSDAVPAAEEIADQLRVKESPAVSYRPYNYDSENDKRMYYARAVQSYLSGGTYSLQLDRISGGTDSVEYFLENGCKGYCIHFASAGVLILRELGVPARYASGYLAKQSDFSQKGKTVEAGILDNQAHAWAEIYLDDIGWVPVEMTPGYYESGTSSETEEVVEASAATVADSENTIGMEPLTIQTGDSNQIREETEQPQGEQPQGEQSQSGQQGNGKEDSLNTGSAAGEGSAGGNTAKTIFLRVCRYLAYGLGTVLLLGSVIQLIRLFRRRRKRKFYLQLRSELKQKKNRRAVLRVNRRLYRMLCRKKLKMSIEMPDPVYERKLMETYPQIPKETWSRYMQIVKKAYFSLNDIMDKEAREVCSLYFTALSYNRGTGKRETQSK